MRENMDANEAEIDGGQREMKAQVVALACCIDANRPDVTAKIRA
jgi:hypothetical protein